MKTILLILTIILIFYLAAKIIEFRDRKRHKLIAQEFGPRVDVLLTEISNTDINFLKFQLDSIKKIFMDHLVILEDDDGNILNLCPKCGDTLTVRQTRYYGKILGCPNYPNCRHLVRVDSLDPNIFHSLIIRNFNKE